MALDTVNKDLTTPKTENESLHMAHRELLLSKSAGSTSSKRRRIDDSDIAEMDMKDVGIMALIHKRMNSWELREMADMDFGEQYFGRRLENRSLLSSLYGLRKDDSDRLLVTVTQNVTATRREYLLNRHSSTPGIWYSTLSLRNRTYLHGMEPTTITRLYFRKWERPST